MRELRKLQAVLLGISIFLTLFSYAGPAHAVLPTIEGSCAPGDNTNVCGPFAATVGGGDVILVFVEILSNSAAVVSVTSVTDGGDTFAQQKSMTVTAPADFANPFPAKLEIWSALHLAGAAVTVTVILSGGTINYDVEAMGVTNIGKTAIATATGSCVADPGVCGTITTTTSNAFSPGNTIAVAAMGGWGLSTITAGTGFTTIPAACAGGNQACMEYSLTVGSPTSYPMNCATCGASNKVAGAVAGAVFSLVGAGVFTCVITNMDGGNFLLPNGKVYDFRCTVESSAINPTNARITDVSLVFNDTVHIITLDYANASTVAEGGFLFNGFRILSGNAYVAAATGSATSTINGGVRKIVVDFKLSLSPAILDATNRGLLLTASNANNISRGGEYVQKNYFNIMNAGGSVSTLSAGSCLRPKGYDIYEVSCRYNASPKSWMAVNSTWYQLQHYSAEFSIKLSCPEAAGCAPGTYADKAGNTRLWQDFAHSGGAVYSNPGDWKVRFGLYHYDNSTWVKGINVQIQMRAGAQTTNDQWTDLSVAWYSGNTLIRNETTPINNWIQQGLLSQETFWIDLWYSNNNASTSEAGRIGSYYTGMHNSGFLWWTSWSPKLQNATDSQIFMPLKDHTGKVMPVANAQFSKVFMNMSRPFNATHGGGYRNFNATTKAFKSQDFTRVLTGPMTGIPTPLFNSAIVPIIQNTGFLSPLINALSSIGNFIINGLVTLGNTLWNALGARFPWFTNAFGTFGALVVNFASLMGNIAGYLSSFLIFMGSAFGPVITIMTVIGQAWATIQGIYLPIFSGANLSAMITIIVLWVFSGYIIEAAEKEDTGAFIRLATGAWHVTQTLLFWTWALAKVLIDTIEGLIP